MSLNVTEIPPLEASIDPESSDDSESQMKKKLELNISVTEGWLYI